MQNKILGILVGVILVVALIILVGILKADKTRQESLGLANSFGAPIDLVGTRTGTTTTGVSFYARAASTTYPFPLGNNEENVVLSIKSLATSTASGFASFSILSSNDSFCGTASTTYSAVQNNYVKSDVKWADAGNHIKNASAVTSLSTGTTTIGFTNDGTNQGKELILTDVNARCLAVEVAASSTVLQVQAMAR